MEIDNIDKILGFLGDENNFANYSFASSIKYEPIKTVQNKPVKTTPPPKKSNLIFYICIIIIILIISILYYKFR
jgi:hypothetical protein